LIVTLQLLGLVKLPLNSLYMSYKEARIVDVLLKSQVNVEDVSEDDEILF